MIEQLRKTASLWVAALGVVAIAALSGCQSGTNYGPIPAEAGNTLHVGEVVSVMAVPLSGPEGTIAHQERIGEDGTISLLYLGQVTAAGKTPTQLQKEIHDLYVPKYYKGMNVTVSGESRYFYVIGEVRSPSKYEHPGDLTVVKAISTAGGFTDFAKKSKVQIIHNDGKTQIENVTKAIENPTLDLPVYPGDRIIVPRRFW
jgi:polysaccharide export outer membrane protein